MGLSRNRLENLLDSKGFVVTKYFVMDGMCSFIEIQSQVDTTLFYMYVSSRLNFKMNTHEGDNIYKISYLELGDLDKIINESFARNPDDLYLEEKYGSLDITEEELNKGGENAEIQEKLEKMYDRPINLKGLTKEDSNIVKEMIRQTKRLSYCVSSTPYRLLLLYKNYVSVLERDDSIECFIMKEEDMIQSRTKKFRVLIDLDVFIERKKTVGSDLKKINEGIYKILDKNQSTHDSNIIKLLEEKEGSFISSQGVMSRKDYFNENIAKFEDLLQRLNEKQEQLYEQLDNLERDKGNLTFNDDIQYTHQKGKIEDEIRRGNLIKRKIIANTVLVRDNVQDLYLTIDNIQFDNTIMIDEIFKNIKKLSEYEEN